MTKLFSYLIALLTTTLLISGCGSGSQENSFKEVSLKIVDGSYVSGDKKKDYHLVANRPYADVWEIFNLIFLEDSTVKIETSDYAKVRLSRENQLIFGSSEDQNFEPFRLIKVDSLRYNIRTDNGLFIVTDSADKLFASDSVGMELVFEIKKLTKNQDFFSLEEYVLLTLSLLLILASLVFFWFYRKYKLSLILLLLGGLALRIFIAMLDPFLNIWDEQFHALVAKNMITHPFSPMLYQNQFFDTGSFSWIDSHIWLHKQPLFLWQIALSLKAFGISAFAVRIPSIILSTLTIGLIYKSGKLLVNRNTGYFAAVLFAVSNFCLTLVAGGYATDHNDIAFMFYITASIWAWLEYKNATTKRRKTLFLVLIGVFSGMAVLVKWLVGLVVFSGWGLSVLFSRKERGVLKNYLNILLSFGISVLIFLPWQVFISNAFPDQSAYEFALNTSHFFNIIEGHGGDWLHHFNQTNFIYGFAFPFMIVFSVVFFKKIKRKELRVFSLVCFVIVYVFFSIAATKMIAFTFCVSLFGFLAIGAFIDSLLNIVVLNKEIVKNKIFANLFKLVIVGLVINNTLNFEKIQYDHTMKSKDENSSFANKTHNHKVLISLNKSLKHQSEYVLYNTKDFQHIQAMFFANFAAAFSGIPKLKDIARNREMGYKTVIMESDDLPDYIKNDKEILLFSGYKH